MCTATLLPNYSMSLLALHCYVVLPFCEMSLLQNLTLAINWTLAMFWFAVTVTLLFHIQTDKLLVSGNLTHHVWLGHSDWSIFSPLQSVDFRLVTWTRVRLCLFLVIAFTCDSTQLSTLQLVELFIHRLTLSFFWVLSLILCVYICLLSQTFWARGSNTVSLTR